MKITKDQLLNFLTDLSLAYELPPLIEKVEEVIEALQNEELEIEGYERANWVKFDPNDEATHPMKTDEYLVALDGWAFAQAVIFYKSKSAFDTQENVTHWRPLPKPPVETEDGE